MSNPEEGGSSGQVPGRYKFKEMKVHSSDEWMAGATKKYRKVFDRYETTYLRVEISFFNKLFDEEKDAIELIRVKEILQNLETATDKCEDAANVLESIIVKYS